MQAVKNSKMLATPDARMERCGEGSTPVTPRVKFASGSLSYISEHRRHVCEEGDVSVSGESEIRGERGVFTYMYSQSTLALCQLASTLFQQ